MTIEVTANHFIQREQAIAEIRSDGLYLAEVDVKAGNLAPAPHVHGYRVDVYVLDGVFELHETDTGRTHLVKAGGKAMVPAGTLHSEGLSAFRAAIGLSVDPSTLNLQNIRSAEPVSAKSDQAGR